MAEKTISKVVYGGKTLIDLTSDTVTADKLLSGVIAHDKSGAAITGACTYDADTSDATAASADFNPRSLAGATVSLQLDLPELSDFNPRSLAGATSDKVILRFRR